MSCCLSKSSTIRNGVRPNFTFSQPRNSAHLSSIHCIRSTMSAMCVASWFSIIRNVASIPRPVRPPYKNSMGIPRVATILFSASWISPRVNRARPCPPSWTIPTGIGEYMMWRGSLRCNRILMSSSSRHFDKLICCTGSATPEAWEAWRILKGTR